MNFIKKILSDFFSRQTRHHLLEIDTNSNKSKATTELTLTCLQKSLQQQNDRSILTYLNSKLAAHVRRGNNYEKIEQNQI